MATHPPRSVGVLGTGSFLPERIVDNAELADRFGCTEEWILERTGIRERRYVSNGTATSDLALSASRGALEAAGIGPEQIDLIICATYSPDYAFPATACLVQDRLGAENAGAFDLEAACSGFITALLLGSQSVASGFAERVLIIGADVNSTLVHPADRNTAVLFGDGAGAAVLGPVEDGKGLLAGHLGSDGAGWKHFVRPAGGSRLTPSARTIVEKLHHIRMEGRELFKFGVRTLVDTAKKLLLKARLDLDAVDLFIPHQANLRIIQAAMERLGIPRERTFINLDRYGNTAAASIGIALDEAVRGGRLRPGSTSMLVGFGAGLSWAGGILRG
jgi:3-oxoacyl-[acyl-carrier-protein] synthase-3